MDIGKDLQQAYADGYAKAIDEFANAVANYIENATTEGVENLLFMARSTVLKEIAEQLKEEQ